ncbi:MAG: TonB-dependent receptor [Rhodospirillaceae bacterium]|nr:TonB-dependent receptor [Rhodospirillaceae bacterium]
MKNVFVLAASRSSQLPCLSSWSRARHLTRQILLATLCLPPAVSASAQQEQPNAAEQTAQVDERRSARDDDNGIEELVVTGRPLRDSLEASLAAQQKADNVVNVIASDTIGRFPDLTAAAALARLPAVAVQRDQGQERFIQVRGAPAKWTSVSFDGINVLGAQDRVFRFDSVPAALIDRVIVNKTLLPDMPAEALAGRVSIETFSPLRNPDWQFLGQGGYGKVDLGDGPQKQLAGRASWANETFGAMIAGSFFEFEQQTDNTEPRYNAGGLASLRTAKYIIVRQTNSLTGKIEFRPSDGHTITFNSLYTEFKDDEERNQYTYTFTGARSGTRGFASGDLVAVPVQGAFEKGDYLTSTFYNVLRGQHEWSSWSGTWDVAYTETEDDTDLPLIFQSAANAALRPSIVYDNSDRRYPLLTIHDTVSTGGVLSRGARRDSLNQAAFDTETLFYFGLGTKTKSYTFKGDLDREWESFGTDATLAFGGQVDRRKSEDPGNVSVLRPNGTAGTFVFRTAATELGQPWTPFSFITSEPVDEDFPRGYTWSYIDNVGMRRQVDALLTAAGAANAAGRGTYPLPIRDASLANTVDEDIYAGYAMNTWRWDRQTLVAGARVEHVKITSSGVAVATGAGGVPVRSPVSFESSRTDVFPSIHWSLDLSDQLKYRLSGISGAARPSFGELRATQTINDIAGLETVTGGNPQLKPERALGFDTSLEWYFDDAALLSANGFYRDVKDVLFDSTTVVGDTRFNFGGVDRSRYRFTTTVNGNNGKLYGLEMTYNHPWTFLPEPFDGFGVQASVAFLKGNFRTATGRKVDFPGTSKRVTNIAVFYENFGLSTRLSYQHRTDWVDDFAVIAEGDLYWNASERLDFSARYQINDYVGVYFDANNLTDAVGLRYEGTEDRPFEVEGFGRRYLAGVRFNY